MSEKNINETGKEISKKITGNTLKVYSYLLTNTKPIGVRELQRALGFSSPSIAFHHLSKLIEWGLVDRNKENKYFVSKPIKIGILKQFVIVFKWFIPRYALYTGLYLGMLITYLILSMFFKTILFHELIVLITLLIAIITGIYETINMWKALKEFQ